MHKSSRLWCTGVALLIAGGALPAFAQTAGNAEQTRATLRVELPDAPDFSTSSLTGSTDGATAPMTFGGGQLPRVTPTVNGHRYHRIIQPGGFAPPLTGIDKIKLSVVSRLSVIEVGSTLISAGISQARDSRPHYGDDAGAFGERFGALALKHFSQALFSYGLFAAALHEDPRYYVLGRTHSVGSRILYAAERLVVTRNDSGGSGVNFAKLAGLAAGNGITQAYYPQQDRGGTVFIESMGTSLYGTVINNEIHEFLGDLLRAFHKHS